VRAALDNAGAGLSIGEPRPVPEADWSEAWKQGLEALEVSPQLRVRPSFVSAVQAPGQAELVIDPGQAFGTGGHASTLLALEWIAALAPELPANAGVLDVGCGTGILALAALRLGAARGLALDIDPLAGDATRENAAANGLAGRLDVVVGPLSAVPPAAFDLVVANLLESEMLPLLEGIAAHTAFGGAAVLSGLLAEQVGRATDAAAAAGLRRVGVRERTDATGDTWVALLTRR
jgi:ribosomal protein L11 methyltransferase